MYTNILIPTDGSELAGKAVEHGIALAKRTGAKATVLTVLPPFHTFTTDAQMIEDTPAQYKARIQKQAAAGIHEKGHRQPPWTKSTSCALPTSSTDREVLCFTATAILHVTCKVAAKHQIDRSAPQAPDRIVRQRLLPHRPFRSPSQFWQGAHRQ